MWKKGEIITLSSRTQVSVVSPEFAETLMQGNPVSLEHWRDIHLPKNTRLQVLAVDPDAGENENGILLQIAHHTPAQIMALGSSLDAITVMAYEQWLLMLPLSVMMTVADTQTMEAIA